MKKREKEVTKEGEWRMKEGETEGQGMKREERKLLKEERWKVQEKQRMEQSEWKIVDRGIRQIVNREGKRWKKERDNEEKRRKRQIESEWKGGGHREEEE